MNKQSIILFAVGSFLILLCGAVVYDSYSRAAGALAYESALSDDLATLEGAAIKKIQSLGLLDGEAARAADRYDQGSGREKRDAFESFIVAIGPRLSSLSAENTIQRRALDEYLGAINRRALVLERYAEAQSATDQAFTGFRGAIAGIFLSRN